MTDVFISYARNDRDRVRNIALALTAEGFAVWWDPEIKPGKQWNDAIRKALDDAAAVVVCWSPTSAKSNWVAAECNHANGRRALVPVMVKGCNPPIPFNMIQSADLTRWRGDPDHAEWVAVLREVRRLVEAKRKGFVAAPPPGEAEGATMAGASYGAGAGYGGGMGGPYRLSSTRGRMGPRFSQLLMSTVVIGVVLTASLVAASNWDKIYTPPPGEIERVEVAPMRRPDPIDEAPEAPTRTASLRTPEVPEAPQIGRTPTRPQPERPRQPEPTPQREPENPPVEERADIPALEQCAARLAASCPAANGTPIGFRANNRIDGAERRFLAALGAQMEGRVTASANDMCEGRRPNSRPVRTACEEISFPPRTDQPNNDRPPRAEENPRNNGGFGEILGGILGALVVGAAINNNNDHSDRNDDKPTSTPPTHDPNPPRPRAETGPRPDTANPGTVTQQPGVILRRNPGAIRQTEAASVVRPQDPCASAEAKQHNPQCGGVR